MKNCKYTPLVSVLIPCYNVEKYVEEAIRSIMDQSYTNLEIICINDGSSDQTREILLSLAKEDRRVKYIENDENLKLIETLNNGLKLCRGKYIARMDADDIAVPTRIEEQVEFLERNLDYGIVGSYIKMFGEKNGIWRMETEDSKIRGYIYYGSPFGHPAVLIRKEIIDQNGLFYHKSYLHLEDYKLWIDIAKYTKLANIPKVLLKYRVSEEQISTKYNNAQIRGTIRLRRNLVEKALLDQNITIDFENLTVDDIKNVSRANFQNKYIKMYIKIVLYRSLCGIKPLLYLFWSCDIFRFPLTKSLQIMASLIYPEKYVGLI